MSVTSISKTRNLRKSVNYVLYGNGEKRRQHKMNGTNRASAIFCSSKDGVKGFLRDGRNLVRHKNNRRVVAYNLIQSFPKSEFNVKNKSDVEFANDLGVELAHRLFKDSEILVVTHTDSAGKHVHNHIIVLNDCLSTGKAIDKNRSVKALRACNDDLMRDYNLSTVDYVRDFSKELNGQFDISLIEKLNDARKQAVSYDDYVQRLASQGVTVTQKQKNGTVGLVYKMLDKHAKKTVKGKEKTVPRTRRRKASKLGREFTYLDLQKQFEVNKRIILNREKRLRELKKRQYEQIKKQRQLEQQENTSNTSKKREKSDNQENQNQIIIKRVHIEQATDALQDNTASNDKQAIEELNDVGESSSIKKSARQRRPRPQRVKIVKHEKKHKIKLPTLDIESTDNLLYLNNENQKIQDENQKH